MATTAPITGALDEIRRIVEEEQTRHPIPGVAIGIAAGTEELTAAFGVTNVDHPVPVDPETLFQVGSITKTVLGTLVMRLVEERLLDLHAPVRTYVPELRLRDEAAAAGVTLGHCLTHTTGWFGDHFEDHGSNDDALTRYVESMKDFEQQVPLGTEWAYNNAAFCLAGRAVEAATGQPIERAIRERVFEPLRLTRTFFFADEVITRRFASGHNVFDGKPRVARPWAIPRAENAVGGIISTVGDLLRYARFHMGDGTTESGYRLLSAQSLEQMHAPLVRGPLGASRGIAWSVEDISGVRMIGHNGATIGQQALLWVAPRKRFAIAMLTNSSQATQLQNAITKWSWRRYLGIERPASWRFDPSAEDVERVPGKFRNPAADVEIAREGARFVFHQFPHGSLRKIMEEPPPIPEPVDLVFVRRDRMLLLGGPLKDSQIELLGDPPGQEWIRFGGRLYKRTA